MNPPARKKKFLEENLLDAIMTGILVLILGVLLGVRAYLHNGEASHSEDNKKFVLYSRAASPESL